MPLRPHWAGMQSCHPVPLRQLQGQHCHPLHCAVEMTSPNPGSESLCSRFFTQALPWKEVGWICCQNSILNHLNAAEKPHFCCNAWGFIGMVRKALAYQDSPRPSGLGGHEEVQQNCEQLINLLRFPILLNLWIFLD